MDTLLACIPMTNTGKQTNVSSSQQLSIDDMDISVRARNCLKAANILTVQDLEKHTDEQLLRLPNLGLKTLFNIRRATHSFELVFRNVPNPTKAEVVEQRVDEPGTGTVSNHEPALLEDELFRIVSLCGSRNAEIFTKRYGFSGDDPETLQDVGDQFQITRERVRQICSKVATQIRRRKPKAPTLEIAMDIIQQYLPAKAEYLQTKYLRRASHADIFQ